VPLSLTGIPKMFSNTASTRQDADAKISTGKPDRFIALSGLRR